jgi:hypothetical protein
MGSERPSVGELGNGLALVVALLALSSFAAGAEGPSGRCRAVASSKSVSVHVELDDLFSGELLRLLTLGLEGRLRVEVELLQKRSLWFGKRVARQSLELTVARDPQGEGLLLDGEILLLDPERLRLPRLQLPLDGGDPQRHEVQVRAQLRVITAGTLGKMATWVAGGDGKQEERSALGAGVLSLLADELARSVELTCPVVVR